MFAVGETYSRYATNRGHPSKIPKLPSLPWLTTRLASVRRKRPALSQLQQLSKKRAANRADMPKLGKWLMWLAYAVQGYLGVDSAKREEAWFGFGDSFGGGVLRHGGFAP